MSLKEPAANVVNAHQRPKVEQFDDPVFVVLQMPLKAEGAVTEQITMFIGEGLLLTFQERPDNCFEPARERLRQGKGRIRRIGADYLAYALIDTIVDGYCPLLEAYGEWLEHPHE